MDIKRGSGSRRSPSLFVKNAIKSERRATRERRSARGYLCWLLCSLRNSWSVRISCRLSSDNITKHTLLVAQHKGIAMAAMPLFLNARRRIFAHWSIFVSNANLVSSWMLIIWTKNLTLGEQEVGTLVPLFSVDNTQTHSILLPKAFKKKCQLNY